MKDSKEMLKQEMRTHFAVDARRIDLLARLLIALLQVCRVSYAQLSLALKVKVKRSSNVKGLQRFFKELSFSHRAYVQFIWKQFASGQTVLAIDGTDWKFDRHHINVLMIGITHAHRIFATQPLPILRKPRKVFGLSLYMSGQQLSGNEYLILISSLKARQIVSLYQQRWQIELLFGCLKSRGFRFQDTHQQIDQRINIMIFVLALALCWALKTGEWLLEQGYSILTLILLYHFCPVLRFRS